MGRIISSLAIILFLSIVFAGPSAAGELRSGLVIDTAALRFYDAPGGVVIESAGCHTTNWLGFPALPYRVVSVLLPQGEAVRSCRVEVNATIVLDDAFPAAEFHGDLLEDGTARGLAASGREVVSEDGVFPRWRIRHLGTGYRRGFRVANFAVYPFRLATETGRLVLDHDVTLVVETEPASPDTDRLERRRHVDGFREDARREIESLVVNPGEAAGYVFDDAVVDDGTRGFLPSYLPSMEGSGVSYLIITSEEMAPAFQELADWKTEKGVPAVVRTTEWIRQNFRSGTDLGESIRFFIQEAYAKWGVDWVLLGGDSDIIPARFGYVSFYTGEHIPTDMYYACLDGTWNDDGDSLWAEAYHDASEPGDEADLYAEVYIGRLPASTLDEAELMVGKTIDYATPVDVGSKRRFVLLGEVIFPPDYEPGGTIVTDGAEILQGIYTAYLDGDPETDTRRLYETYTLYPGSTQLTVDNTLDTLSIGANHVMHAGHGGKYNMSVGNGSILNFDAKNVTNGDALFSMYLMNCTNCAFDTDCLAEYFLLNTGGGAFAVTGSSRSAFPSASRPYMDNYYNLFLANDVVRLGEVFTKSREPFTPSAVGETADRWTHFIYNLLGDPEASMFQGAAYDFDVTAPASLDFGPNGVTIGVSSGGSPVEGALVCLLKEGDDYVYGETGPGGSVTFDDFLVKEGGEAQLVVTGRNHRRYAATIPVVGGTAAYIRIKARTISDGATGNDDGALDAGETADIWVELENTGGTAGEKLYAILRSGDAAVSVLDSTALYPDIPAGEPAYAYDGFVVAVDVSTADEHVVDFTLEVRDSTGGMWSETFALEVRAPELELYLNLVSDEPPIGNGNDVQEPGENVLVSIGVKNFGTGSTMGLEGVLRSSDAEVIITDSVSAYADLATLDVGYGDGFILTETTTGSVNYMTVDFADDLGRTYSRRIELRRPGIPTGLILNSSYGPTEMHASWHAPTSTEKLRFMVYRSLSSGGPYTAGSRDPVMHGMFRDYGLLPSTRYYYVVAAVDSCGNLGDPGGEVTATTSPPQLAGWPNKMDKESSSSVKIADIDGDSHPEIVVGSNYVHAWHADGIEVRDGDSQPVTWGIFNTEGSGFTASVALAQLDGEPGNEIVAAAWDTRELFVFRADGSTMPGWPKLTSSFCWAAPVVGDLDDDGDNEIVAYDAFGKVYVWHHDGTELIDGDDNAGTDGVFLVMNNPEIGHYSTPALADVDNDGVVELIVCGSSSSTTVDSIQVRNGDGSSVPGWPKAIEDLWATISASPAVGDIDDDGDIEIVVSSSNSKVYGLNHDGTWMAGWPKWVYNNHYYVGSPALADLTGDGYLEVVIPSRDNNCYVFRYNGQALTNWPQPYAESGATEASPTIADLDGDGGLDIVLPSEEGYINAWNVAGEHLSGFPIQVNAYCRTTPMVRDLDLDGDFELIATSWDQNVYVWDLDAPYRYGAVAWNGFHGNVQNTGWTGYEGPTAAGELAFAWRLSGGLVEIDWVVAAGPVSWDIHRAADGSAFELYAADLRPDEGGHIAWTDRGVEEGVTYSYRLVATDDDRLFVETDAIEVPVARARLYPNHPNPFNPTTTVSFTVPGGEADRHNVLLAVYDVRGRLVRTLVSGVVPGGRHEAIWDGSDNRGSQVASGVYFARFAAAGVKATRKMVLLR
ncbi:MAG: VCBS repeat-containing protein [Candidatus Krumholzibacteriota bacterium]|nr:VCBS repeat-containing protein [Candidatus Krumholzibacteriota bacterium]